MSDEGYRIHLPAFDGPLDLLLNLIEKRQMEITTISLVAVADQFIAYVQSWDEPPVARLADFVSMASRLLLIKSRALLPRSNRPEDEAALNEALADAEELRRNLLEYKLAKEIAAGLRERAVAGLQSFARPTPPQDVESTIIWTPPQIIGLSLDALAAAFRRVLAEQQANEPAELPPPIVTIAEKIAEIEAMLAAYESITLVDLITSDTRRIVIVVTFLAVLELWHQRRIVVTQESLFDPIRITRAPAGTSGP